LGPIEERMKGDLTLKLIGGLETLSQARQTMTEARKAGFTTAFIVMEQNGQLVKVN